MQQQFNGRALEATFSSLFSPVVTDQIKPCAELWLLCLERKPLSQTVPCWVTQQGMTFLPFVFQTQSLQMEAFSTQTKPTIKTDDLFTIQTNHFTIKTQQLQTQQLLTIKNPPSSYDFLPSNPMSSYCQNQPFMVKTNHLLPSKPTTQHYQNKLSKLT